MTAPTAPTAPLPSELQVAIDTLDEGMRSDRGCGKSGLNYLDTIREHLLTMQRERDEARADRKGAEDSLVAYVNNACKEYDRKCAYIVRLRKQLSACAAKLDMVIPISEHNQSLAKLKQQLAASERTCAELRAELDENLSDYMTAVSQFCGEKANRLAAERRAEAAERTVEGLREQIDALKK